MDILQFLPKDVYDALVGAAAPNAGNVFATIADLSGGGATDFIGLTDTPASYVAGDANKFIRVKGTFDGLEYVAGSAINISEFNNDAGYLTSVQLSDNTDVVSAANTNRFVLVANGTTGYVGRALLEADIFDFGTYEPAFSKNTAFNKDFGTAAGTVAEGNDSRIVNGQTAFSWGNHASAGYVTTNLYTASGSLQTGSATTITQDAITDHLIIAAPSKPNLVYFNANGRVGFNIDPSSSHDWQFESTDTAGDKFAWTIAGLKGITFEHIPSGAKGNILNIYDGLGTSIHHSLRAQTGFNSYLVTNGANNLGVGTSTPTLAKLQVEAITNGARFATSSAGLKGVTLSHDFAGAKGNSIEVYAGDGTTIFHKLNAKNGFFGGYLAANGATFFGIGTTLPIHKLTVDNGDVGFKGASLNTEFLFDYSGNNLLVGSGAGTNSKINVNGDTEMYGNGNGIIVADATTGTRYRIYMDNGVLSSQLA